MRPSGSKQRPGRGKPQPVILRGSTQPVCDGHRPPRSHVACHAKQAKYVGDLPPAKAGWRLRCGQPALAPASGSGFDQNQKTSRQWRYRNREAGYSIRETDGSHDCPPCGSVSMANAIVHRTRDGPWGLGWQRNHPGTSGSWSDLLDRNVFGHTGATGPMLWIDRQRDGFCMLLTTAVRSRAPWRLVQLSNIVASAFV